MKLSQCDRIIEYIEKHGSITQLQAYLDIGCWRLASRITDLKRKGYAIKTDTVKVENRDGELVPVARYSFAEVGNANSRV
jgi:hypothetical protein